MKRYAVGRFAWNNPFGMEEALGDFMQKVSENILGPYISGRTLNVGCGSSRLGAVRLDIERIGAANLIGDACYLPFKDKSFDTVVLVAVLHHIPSYEKALKEAVRVSRKTIIGIEPNIFYPHLCTLKYYLGFGGERALYLPGMKRIYKREGCRLIFEQWCYGLKLLGTITKRHNFFIKFDRIIPGFLRAAWAYVYLVADDNLPRT